jgi:outer membrane scaffolding protein for murein synthesis (MipA/OmpV family)
MRVQTALLGLSLVLTGVPALADSVSWKTMPVMDSNYQPDFTLSALVGSMDPQHAGSDSVIGGELAFNCLLLQPSTGIIRTRVSISKFSNDGLKLTSYEINPHWTFNIADHLSLGFGPGLGYVDAKYQGSGKGLWAAQLGADLDYRVNHINFGVAARWQGTQNSTLSPGIKGADNSLVEARIGYNF